MRTNRTPILAAMCFTLLASAPLIGTAAGQSSRSVDPRRAAAEGLLKPITVSFADARLEDVMKFLGDFTGVQFQVMWLDDRNPDGLDPEALVTLSVDNVPALALLERVLHRVEDGSDSSTWQFTDAGEVQVGPKSRLNRYTTLKLYDIRDLLFHVKDFIEVPNLGLGQIIQGQGGSTQTDFQVEDRTGATEADEAQRIIDIIVNNIEPEQWVDAGGDAASVTFFNGNLLVRAPDYIHRRIVGYSFWPTDSRAHGARIGARDTSAPEGRVDHRDATATAGKKPKN